MIRKVYLSGGMTGRTRAAYVKEFGDAEKYLRGLGFKVKNPARFPMARWPWLFSLLGYKLTLFVAANETTVLTSNETTLLTDNSYAVEPAKTVSAECEVVETLSSYLKDELIE